MVNRGHKFQRGHPGYSSRAATIIHRQEELAIRLLDRALDHEPARRRERDKIPENEPAIDIQLDVFEKVGKWVSIKNKLDEIGETQIDHFKRRIAAESKTDQIRAFAGQPGGIALTRLKHKLPDRGDRGDDGDSDDPVGEDTPAA